MDLYNPSFMDSSPAFQHIRPFWVSTADWPTHNELSENTCVRFVSERQHRQHFSDHYEVRIYEQREVETRLSCWHDLCNALTWKAFPESKWALTKRYYHAIQKREASWSFSSSRSKEEDMCTVLNENGLIIAYDTDQDAQDIQSFSWERLFWERREGLAERLELFFLGHALLEKSLAPYIGMTGHAILISVPSDFFAMPVEKRIAHIDVACAQRIGELTCIQDLNPFPLLGFPGFVPDSEDPSFYRNTRYFRSGRRKRKQRGSHAEHVQSS